MRKERTSALREAIRFILMFQLTQSACRRHQQKRGMSVFFPPLSMQRNAILEPDAIDTFMTEFPSLGLGESVSGTDAIGRHRRSVQRRHLSDQSDHTTAAMMELLEGRSMPSGTALDTGVAFDPLHDPSLNLRNDAKLSSADSSAKLILSGNGYAEIAQQKALDFGTGDFTISASAKFQRSGEIEVIVSNMTNSPIWQGYALRRHGGGTIEFGVWENAMQNKDFTVMTTAKFNDFNHTYDITAVRAGKSLRIFVDGIEQTTKVWEGTPNAYNVSNGAPAILGGISYADVYRLKGEISSVALRKGAYTPEDIANMQKAAAAPAPTAATESPASTPASVSTQTLTAIAETIVSQSGTPTVNQDSPELVLPPVRFTVQAPSNGDSRSEVFAATPFDHSVFVSPFGTLTFDHIGGSTGLSVLKRNLTEMMNWSKAHPTAVCTLYADDAKTIKVGEIVFVGDLANGSVRIESSNALPVRRSLLPTGVDALMPAPLLRAASIQGPNITLAMSSPVSGTSRVCFMNLENDGLFTSSAVEGSTDGSVVPVTLGLNITNPTGDYDIVLFGPDGKSLSRIRAHWDCSTKQISLCDGGTVWSGTEAQGKAMNSQMQEVLALSNNPTIASGALATMQQETLITGIHTMSAPYCEMCPNFEAAFWSAHPEWKDDVIHQTAIDLQKTKPTYSVTQIYESLMRQRTDTMAISREAYGQFYGLLGDLMQQGLTVLSAVRSGGNESDLRHNFAVAVDRVATNLTMYKLSGIGIRMPDSNTILEGVKLVWSAKCEEIIRIKADEARKAAGDAYRAQILSSDKYVMAGDGTPVLKTDPRASTALVYYTDPQERLTLRPQGVGVTQQTGLTYGLDLGSTPTIVASFASNETISSIYPSIGLVLDEKGEFNKPQTLSIYPTKFGEITFTLTQNSMVNFWTNGIDNHDVSLNLKGGTTPLNKGDGYTSTKAGKTGESVSLKLAPGNYTLRVQDKTSGDYMGLPTNSATGFPASVGIDIKKYNSAKIEGMISIPESPEAMPVSMSVAEFDTAGKRIEDYSHVTALNPSKPVFVVIHGRVNSEKSDAIVELAQSLSLSGVQILTVDWSNEAKDNSSDAFGLEGANWTPAVGKWITHQLQSLGFTGDKINFAGPSWGSYVAYFAAQEMGQVNSILALDSAANDLVMNNIKSSDIDFRDVTKMSWAIESSPIGSNARAASADYSFTIDSSFLNRADVDMRAHNFSTTAISAIAKDSAIRGAGQVLLDPRLLIAGKAPTFQTPVGESLTPTQDAYALLTLESKYFGSGWEGVISVDTYTVTDSQGKTWVKTLPKSIEFKDAQSNTRTELLQTLPDSIISAPKTQI